MQIWLIQIRTRSFRAYVEIKQNSNLLQSVGMKIKVTFLISESTIIIITHPRTESITSRLSSPQSRRRLMNFNEHRM